jgi:hypothetical protein
MKKRLESGPGLRQKYEGAEKSGKAHFSARLIFLPSFRWAANREAQSKSVKVDQTDVRVRQSLTPPGINMQILENQWLAKKPMLRAVKLRQTGSNHFQGWQTPATPGVFAVRECPANS